MSRETREIAWIKSARKEFGQFPVPVQRIMARTLTVAAEGGKSDIAKPMKGLGGGIFEIALPYRSDGYRVIYAIKLDEVIWVVHAFQKKSSTGIKTNQKDINLIKLRLKRIKELLR